MSELMWEYAQGDAALYLGRGQDRAPLVSVRIDNESRRLYLTIEEIRGLASNLFILLLDEEMRDV